MIAVHIALPQLQMFFLIFLRISAMLMTLPVFSSKSIPFLFKVGLAFSISVIVFTVLKFDRLRPARLGIPAVWEVVSLVASYAKAPGDGL